MLRYDVFLSYSRADTERVRPLLEGLRKRGYSVFFDVQSIEPGSVWKNRLERAIRSSRTLILCWSDEARSSDYITFEYSRAESLGKPIFPWLLDHAPLPAMLELQGITDTDGDHVAEKLLPFLGMNVRFRRRIAMSIAMLVAILCGLALWLGIRPVPPQPWVLQGEVHDHDTHLGLEGVRVDIEASGRHFTAYTGADGHYRLQMPGPQPATVNLEYRREGYSGDRTFNWDVTQFDSTDLKLLNSTSR